MTRSRQYIRFLRQNKISLTKGASLDGCPFYCSERYLLDRVMRFLNIRRLFRMDLCAIIYPEKFFVCSYYIFIQILRLNGKNEKNQ